MKNLNEIQDYLSEITKEDRFNNLNSLLKEFDSKELNNIQKAVALVLMDYRDNAEYMINVMDKDIEYFNSIYPYLIDSKLSGDLWNCFVSECGVSVRELYSIFRFNDKEGYVSYAKEILAPKVKEELSFEGKISFIKELCKVDFIYGLALDELNYTIKDEKVNILLKELGLEHISYNENVESLMNPDLGINLSYDIVLGEYECKWMLHSEEKFKIESNDSELEEEANFFARHWRDYNEGYKEFAVGVVTMSIVMSAVGVGKVSYDLNQFNDGLSTTAKNAMVNLDQEQTVSYTYNELFKDLDAAMKPIDYRGVCDVITQDITDNSGKVTIGKYMIDYEIDNAGEYSSTITEIKSSCKFSKKTIESYEQIMHGIAAKINGTSFDG